MIMTRKYFITFGDGGSNYIKAVDRLLDQVSKTNLFDKIIKYTDEDLKKDTYFWNKIKS